MSYDYYMVDSVEHEATLPPSYRPFKELKENMKLLRIGLFDSFGPVSFRNCLKWSYGEKLMQIESPWNWDEWDGNRKNKIMMLWKQSPCGRVILSPSSTPLRHIHYKSALNKRYKALIQATGMRGAIRILFQYNREGLKKDYLGFNFDGMTEVHYSHNYSRETETVFMLASRKLFNLIEREYPDEYMDFWTLLLNTPKSAVKLVKAT